MRRCLSSAVGSRRLLHSGGGLTIASLLLIIAACSLRQANETNPSQGDSNHVLRPLAVELTTTKRSDQPSNIGSGIIVRSAKSRLYLVTVPHVARWIGPRSRLRVRSAGKDTSSYSLESLAGEVSPSRWHGDPYVALIELAPSERAARELEKVALPAARLATDSSFEPPIFRPPYEDELHVIGHVENGARPAVMRARRAGRLIPARIPRVRGDLGSPDSTYETLVFALDRPGAHGMSGGPVMRELPDGSFQCVGLIEANLNDALTLVTPSAFVLDAIETLESRSSPAPRH